MSDISVDIFKLLDQLPDEDKTAADAAAIDPNAGQALMQGVPAMAPAAQPAPQPAAQPAQPAGPVDQSQAQLPQTVQDQQAQQQQASALANLLSIIDNNIVSVKKNTDVVENTLQTLKNNLSNMLGMDLTQKTASEDVLPGFDFYQIGAAMAQRAIKNSIKEV